ncbi:MAG: sialidase family protein [Bacteroidota bacterium]
MRIHILALLLFIQSFVACQSGPNNTAPLAADLGFQSATGADSPAANIVFQSTDNGQNWQDISAGLPTGLPIGSGFAADNEIFLGSEDGLYRRRVSKNGPIWEKYLFLYGSITNIISGKNGLYACSYERGAFQNIPGTDVWKSIGNTLKDKSVRTILERGESTLLVGTDSGIFKSADGGRNWKQVFSGGIVLDIVAMGDVLVAGGFNGALRSTDEGEHWDNTLNENILAKKTGVIDGHFFTILGTEDVRKPDPAGITNRLRISDDMGKTWHRIEQSLLPIQNMFDMDVRLADAKDLYDLVQVGKYLFCSFDTGIFRSADEGKTWEPVFPTKGKTTYTIVVSGNVIYAVPGGGC